MAPRQKIKSEVSIPIINEDAEFSIFIDYGYMLR
jgi:hypothetical protein